MSINKMRILLTNDDGVHAPGIHILSDIASQISDDVWIVAPETEQSGAAHSLTIHTPLRIKQLGERRFAVSGTPTDSVLMATQKIMKDHKPDLVLSGVNLGSNLGEDVTYSGTVAGAMEGALLGIRSIALSQDHSNYDTPNFDVALTHGVSTIRSLLNLHWPSHLLMNVNFPSIKPSNVKGLKAVKQGKRKIGICHQENADPRGRPYYWIDTRRDETLDNALSDLSALREGYISVTPLGLDLTEYNMLEIMDKKFLNLPPL
jgi:5'-nucleotidase